MEKLVIHQAYLNIVEVIYCKPTSTININEEKLKAFPLKKKTRLYTLSLNLFNIALGILEQEDH